MDCLALARFTHGVTPPAKTEAVGHQTARVTWPRGYLPYWPPVGTERHAGCPPARNALGGVAVGSE
jgi:hypothetical protein